MSTSTAQPVAHEAQPNKSTGLANVPQAESQPNVLNCPAPTISRKATESTPNIGKDLVPKTQEQRCTGMGRQDDPSPAQKTHSEQLTQDHHPRNPPNHANNHDDHESAMGSGDQPISGEGKGPRAPVESESKNTKTVTERNNVYSDESGILQRVRSSFTSSIVSMGQEIFGSKSPKKVKEELKIDKRNDRNQNKVVHRQENEQLNKDLYHAKIELQSLQEKFATLVESHNLLIASIDNSQFFLRQQEDDETIKNLFRSLYQKVNTWSVAFYTDRAAEFPSHSQLKKHKRLIVTALGRQSVPDDAVDERFNHSVKYNSMRRLFVKGIVGAFIYHKLFKLYDIPGVPHSGSGLWTEYGKEIGVLEMGLALGACDNLLSLRELNEWRANTVSLVSRLTLKGPKGALPEWTKKYLEKSKDDLIKLLVCLKKKEIDRNGLSEGLYDILVQAVEFSKIVQRQRALFTVEYPGLSDAGRSSGTGSKDQNTAIPYKRDMMIDEKDDHSDDFKDMDVNILIFPGLFKRGNSAGEGYDKTYCLVKSLVHCNPQS